jgi:hypothetical protein
MFKKIISLIFLLSLSIQSQSTIGVPYYLDLASWSISYEGNNFGYKTINYTSETANAFKDALTNNINAKYPTISSSWRIKRDNTNGTLQSFQAVDKDICEIVFFNGHGVLDTITNKGNNLLFMSENKNIQWSANNFTLGGSYTKWGFLKGCYSLYSKDPVFYYPMFNGVHSVFGFESQGFNWSWKSSKWYCFWYGCAYTNSWDSWTYFWGNWFNGQTMWESYYNALIQNYNDADNKSYYSNSVPGYTIAMVEVFGEVKNNDTWRPFFGGQEKITETFREETPTYNTENWNYYGLTYNWIEIGNSTY